MALSRIPLIGAAALSLCAGIAAAELPQVRAKAEFVDIVAGKTLTRPLVRLQVSPTGEIAGRGATWDITGNWSWQNGYFCRDLNWGGDNLAYNCQEVRSDGSTIRFTSDQGQGDSAEFKLR